MRLSTILLIYAAILIAGYFLGRRKASLMAAAGGSAGRTLHSLPVYHGYFVLLCGALPVVILLVAYFAFGDAYVVNQIVAQLPADVRALSEAKLKLVINDIRIVASGVTTLGEQADYVTQGADRMNDLRHQMSLYLGYAVILISLLGCGLAWRSLHVDARARNRVESTVLMLLVLAATVAVMTTIGIVFSVLFESIRFFQKVPVTEFLFGLNWSPQTALRADQVGSSGSFGAIPLFVGTLLISGIAMLVALPIGLMVAIYLSEYTTRKVRKTIKPMLELLAGIPTVVYGFFAALTVAPLLRNFGVEVGLEISSESALGAGLVMGIMILPFVSSISDDVISAVPQAMRDGSYGLGATKSETIRRVVLPAALPGIVGGFMLAVSRAIGETMIVVMAAGLAAKLTINPLEAVTTVTVQIVTLLVGDQEFDSAKTLAAFGLGLSLFVVTLILNVIALRVVRKYREQYE